ncbi:DUF421 domain-containing protein [Anaeromyxobacter sp. Red801]|uniref:DUF421 domain-containing protein n=1 Tax=Anaeromyxobacter sp. Red801 TaxID=3411632 RepID=UPI003BA1D584
MDSALWRPELPPWEVVFRAAFVYLFVQLLFRLVGRKEFARWGVSDIVLLFLITTAARKSIVADDASLTTAVVALTTLIGLDWLFSLLTSRSRRAADLFEGRIRQLVRDGALQRDVMRATRVSEDELLAHVRRLGKESLRDVKDAFLERSGSITIVLRGGAGR